MKTLHLNLKKKWFDLILSGEKTEEYREVTLYWCRRLLTVVESGIFDWDSYLEEEDEAVELLVIGIANNYFALKQFDSITFSSDYTKNRPQFEIKLDSIKIHHGLQEWGATENKLYFVLSLGEILNKTNI